MALKDLIKPTPTAASDRPIGITCERYVRGEGKRCAHYVTNGACSLPDEFMCVEWLKANEPGLHPAEPSAPPVVVPVPPVASAVVRDLFGNPVPQVEAPAPKPNPAVSVPVPVAAIPQPTPIDISRLRGFTTEDIESFKALGVEVCLQSESFGELWLVPAYTGQPRRELTPEHLATVLHALSVFPGSRVIAFHPPIKPGPARQENP
jgi:hypothetical protein